MPEGHKWPAAHQCFFLKNEEIETLCRVKYISSHLMMPEGHKWPAAHQFFMPVLEFVSIERVSCKHFDRKQRKKEGEEKKSKKGETARQVSDRIQDL